MKKLLDLKSFVTVNIKLDDIFQNIRIKAGEVSYGKISHRE